MLNSTYLCGAVLMGKKKWFQVITVVFCLTGGMKNRAEMKANIAAPSIYVCKHSSLHNTVYGDAILSCCKAIAEPLPNGLYWTERLVECRQ